MPSLVFAQANIYLQGEAIGTAGAYGGLVSCDGGTTAPLLQCDSSGRLSLSGSYAEDAAHTSGDVGILSLGVYKTTPSSTTTANNDYAAPVFGPLGQYTDPVGKTVEICVSRTPDTSAYAIGDIVGGKLTFASAGRAPIYNGLVQHISVTNTEVDGIAWNLHLFNADPSTSTVADQGALAVSAADLTKWFTTIPVSTGKALSAVEAYRADNLAIPFYATGTSLYGVLETTGAPTWAANQTVNICITVIQD